MEYTHPTGEGGYAQGFPTRVDQHGSGYVPPNVAGGLVPASPPGYQQQMPTAPSSAPNTFQVYNYQSSPMASPVAGYQVASPASDATSPYPRSSPGSVGSPSHSVGGNSYYSPPSQGGSSLSSASANYGASYSPPPPVLPENLGKNNNNEYPQETVSWIKSNNRRDVTLEKSELDHQRERVANFRAKKLMEQTCETAETFRGRRGIVDSGSEKWRYEASKRIEAEAALKREEKARERAQQERRREDNWGKHKLAETTRRVKKSDVDGEFETMHDLKCTFDREREAWARNQALKLLDDITTFD